jgi:hypothetical protein
MKRLTISLAIASLAILAFVATVSAAGPRTQARDQVQAQTTLTSILGLTQEQVADLRQDGMTLAQIAERQKVDPQRLIDALVAQWTTRIDARVADGALTDAQATELKAQLEVKAKAMVNQAAVGGMRGAAVGAGPGSAAGNGGRMGTGAGAGAGMGTGAGRGGAGNGVCDGTGPNGTSS